MSELRTLVLIDELRQLPAETPWVEFKENNTDAQMIGKLLSALSNAARLADQPFAYVLWGVRDGDHAAVGTGFERAFQSVAEGAAAGIVVGATAADPEHPRSGYVPYWA